VGCRERSSQDVDAAASLYCGVPIHHTVGQADSPTPLENPASAISCVSCDCGIVKRYSSVIRVNSASLNSIIIRKYHIDKINGAIVYIDRANMVIEPAEGWMSPEYPDVVRRTDQSQP